MLKPLTALALVLGSMPMALGHTWIEQIRNINAQGDYVGEAGYPRGFKDKAGPGYDGETSMNYMLPPLEQQPPFINASNLLCHPNQRKPVQSDNFPRLQSTPGTWLALRYAENGHVSNPSNQNGHVPGELDLGRRPNGGSVFVYGTTAPKEDEKIADVLRWTKDGQGGDKRGVLLAVNDFDDGRCWEINPVTKAGRMKQFPNYAQGQATDGPGEFPLMCETNVQLPKDADVSKPYTLYWVWQWPVDPAQDPIYPKGKDQYYTTCLDLDFRENSETIQQTATLQFGLAQQDGQAKAVDQFRHRKALIEDAIAGNVGPLFKDENPSGTPFMNSTMTTSAMLDISTLTQNPSASSTSINVVVVTERITVTAPVFTASATPTTQKRAHVTKIRGMSYRD